jgi:hypothetical protein
MLSFTSRHTVASPRQEPPAVAKNTQVPRRYSWAPTARLETACQAAQGPRRSFAASWHDQAGCWVPPAGPQHHARADGRSPAAAAAAMKIQKIRNLTSKNGQKVDFSRFSPVFLYNDFRIFAEVFFRNCP